VKEYIIHNFMGKVNSGYFNEITGCKNMTQLNTALEGVVSKSLVSSLL
jgi:hypothetical protein